MDNKDHKNNHRPLWTKAVPGPRGILVWQALECKQQHLAGTVNDMSVAVDVNLVTDVNGVELESVNLKNPEAERGNKR